MRIKLKMFIELILFNVIHFCGFRLLNAEDVIKCLKNPKEKIRISCPRDYVIYNPVILAGASPSETCDLNPSDCLGTTKEIKRQTDRCFWKKRCVIHFCDIGQIESCEKPVSGSLMNISYVVIKQVNCVPKEIITDICSKPSGDFDYTMGILRSHRGYPRRRPSSNSCSFTIPIKSSHTLLLQTVTEDGEFPFGLKLVNVLKDDQHLSDISKMGEVILHGNTSKGLEIHVDFRWKRKYLYGFMLPFKAYESTMLDSVLRWPNTSRPVMRELGWILDVKAVIEQCAATMEGQVRLSCDTDKVIYSPAFSLSGYTRRNSKCIFGKKYPCGGFSPKLLVQRNECYWKQSCDITWEKSSRIVISKETRCIGYSASTVGFSGHRCVNKDKITDLCTNVTSPINASWGIIRSHSVYPWYFDARFAECKRILIVGGQQAVTLIVQDINLGPDGRDKFYIEHVRKADRRIIMDAKSVMEGHHVTVKGGKLVIKFKPFEASKSGRGFVLVFRRFSVSRRVKGQMNKNDNVIPVPVSAALYNDAAEITQYRLSNRRLCSKRGKIRRKGRACNRRVWTDYFTRLE